ncbi:MAG: MerR family DNA-binding transcriptional regulator [Patescibacteria group bacterium]
MNNFLTIQQAASLLGVSTKTLRRWEAKGILIPQRTAGNQRRYTNSQIENYLSKKNGVSEVKRDSQAASQETALADSDSKTPSLTEHTPAPNSDYWNEELVKSITNFKKGALTAAFIMVFVVISALAFATMKSAGFDKDSLTKVLSAVGIGGGKTQEPQYTELAGSEARAVLGIGDKPTDLLFGVNTPSEFAQNVNFLDTIRAAGIATLSGGIITENQNIDAGTGELTASNVLYGVVAGAGIEVSTGQTPTITNTGVLSVGGKTGAVALTAGTGISISGTTITNSITAGSTFKNIIVGSSTITAGSSSDTLTFAAGTGLSIAADTSSKTVTVSPNGTTVSSAACVTSLNGIVTGTSVCQLGTEQWVVSNGTLYPGQGTLDVLIGGTPSNGTGSANFAFINNNVGTPTFQINGNSVLTSTTLLPAVATSSLTSVGTITSGTWQGTPVATTSGGTGNTAWLTGDLVYASAANTLSRLPIGASSYVLSVSGGVPTWVAASGAGGICTDCVLNDPSTAAINTITPTVAVVPLTLRPFSSGSAHIFDIQSNGGGTTYAYVDINGNFNFPSSNLYFAGGTLYNIDTSGNFRSAIDKSNKVETGFVNGNIISTGSGTLTLGAGKTLTVSNTLTLAGGDSKTLNIGSNSLTFTTSADTTLTLPTSGTVCVDTNNCGYALGTNYWKTTAVAGAITPINSTLDLLVGGDATTSSKFAFMNVAGSLIPVASISAQNAGGQALALSGDGSIQSLRNNSLTLGGTTTGDVLIQPNSDTGDYFKFQSDNTNLTLSTTDGSNLTITPAGLLNLNSTGDMTLDSSTDIILDADGADVIFKDAGTTFATFTNSATDLTITTGGGNILSASALNIGGAAAAAYNYFASDISGVSTPDGVADLYIQDELEVDGTTRFNNVTYTWPSSDAAGSGYPLTSNGAGTLSWTDPATLGTNYWDRTNGALYPKIASVHDLLIGGTTTASAKFAVLNINSGTPTASVSATGVTDRPGVYMSGTGTISSLNKGTLTLGGSDTGNIVLAPGGVTALTVQGANLIAAGTLTGLTGLTVASGTVSLPAGQIDNVELANSSVTINTAGPLGGGGSLSLGGTLSLTCSTCATGTNYFKTTSDGKALTPINSTLDLLVGGDSTSAAKFAFINTSGSLTPTASISANSGNNATFLTGLGNLGTTNAQTLTLGGSSTGNVVLSGRSGANNGIIFSGYGTGILHSNSSGVLTSSAVNLAGGSSEVTGTLPVGNGGTGQTTFGGTNTILYTTTADNLSSIATGNTGALVTSSTGVPSITTSTGANQILRVNSAGTAVGFGSIDLSASGAVGTSVLPIANGGTNKALTLSNGGIVWSDADSFEILAANASSNKCLLSGGAGTPSWGDCTLGGGTNYFKTTSDGKALTPINSTLDLLIGGDSTASAKFSVSNIAGILTPVASLSANTASGGSGAGLVLDGSGSIQTLIGRTLSLGGNSTGNILLNSDGNDRVGIGTTNPTALFSVGSASPFTVTNTGAVAGLTFNGNTITASTGTLTLAAGKTAQFADAFTTSGTNPLTLTTTASTNVTLPVTGTLLTNTAAANQTITSTQNTGTVFGITDSTNLAGAIIGLDVTLSPSSGGGNNQKGIALNVSCGATCGTLYDIYGTTGSWFILNDGRANFASVTPTGTTGGFGWLQRNSGALSPANISDDLLLGGISTTSARIGFTGIAAGNTPTATLSATTTGLVLGAGGTIQSLQNATLTLGGNTTGNIVLKPNNGTGGFIDAQGTIKTATWNGATVGQAYGGTSFSSYSSGDTIYANASSNLTKLPIGSQDQVLVVDSVTLLPKWGTILGGPTATCTNCVITNPTNTYTNIIAASASGAIPLTVRPHSSGSTDAFHIENSTGSTNYFVVSGSGVITTGTWNGTAIGATYGGTGQSVYAVGDLLYADTTTSLAKRPIGSTNQVLAVSAGGLPVWATVSGSGGLCSDCVITGPTTTLTNRISASASGTIALTLQAPSDTSDIFQVRSRDNATLYARIDSSGNFNFPSSNLYFAGGTLYNIDTNGNFRSAIDKSNKVETGFVNGNIISTGSGTLTLGAGKTLTANSSLTLAGTDSKTLTVTGNTTLAANSITFEGTEVLALAAAKNVTFADAFTTSGANPLTLTTTASTNVTLPVTGTLLTNTAAANQTITSTQNTGTVFGVTDATNLAGAIIGQAITLSGTGAQDQTGLQFNLSGATGTNLNDIVGSSSTWKVSTTGNSAFVSVVPTGTTGTFGWFNTASGAISAINPTVDFLLGGSATISSKFAVMNIAGSLTPVASISAQNAAGQALSLSGDGSIQTLRRGTLTLGGNTTGDIALSNPTFGSSTGKNSVLFGRESTGVIGTTTTTSSSQCLLSGSAAPAWATCPGAGAGGSSLWTESSNKLYPTTAGEQVGIGTTTAGDIISSLYISRDQTSGALGKALAIFNQTESQDILTASASGVTKFTILNNGTASSAAGFTINAAGSLLTTNSQTLTLGGGTTGDIILGRTGKNITLPTFTTNGGLLYTNGSGLLTQLTSQGTTGDCLVSGGSGGLPSFSNCASAAGDDWDMISGALSPRYASTVDFLLGSNATASAEFAVTGINDGLPVATISATTGANAGNGLSLTGATSTIQSLRMNTLTLGGSTTGNIVIDSGSSNITFSDAITAPTSSNTINGIVINSGTISSATWNGTAIGAQYGGTGINTSGSTGVPSISAGTWSVSATLATSLGGLGGNVTALGAGEILYSTGTTTYDSLVAGSSNQCLLSGGAGTPSWGNCTLGGGTNYWKTTSDGKALTPINSTLDLLVGGDSTASSKFAFLNVAGGTPTASISANSGNNATYLTGDGTLGTTNRGTLTIGSSTDYPTTGNVLINPVGGTTKLGVGLTNPNNTIQVLNLINFDDSNLSTAIGKNALSGNTGSRNTALGYEAITTNNTGISNAAFGYQALKANSSGSENLAFGDSALVANTTGSDNSAIGYNSLAVNVSGSNNSAVGARSLSSNTGSRNSALGVNSLAGNTSGGTNTALGFNAGYTNTGQYSNKTGSNNVYLGYNAGSWSDGTTTNFNNSTAIGAYSLVNASNSLALGGTGFYAVNVGIGTATPSAVLDIQGGQRGGNSALIVNQTGAPANDILTASASGTTRFTIGNTGNIQFGGGQTALSTLTKTGTTARTFTFPDEAGTICLQSSASCGFTSGTNYWQQVSAGGAIAPIIDTLDLLVGGQTTASAKFAVLNVNSGTPTASVSATGVTDRPGVYMSGTGTISSLNKGTLTLGGSDTGNIVIDSGSNLVTISDATTFSSNVTIAGTTGLTFSSTGGVNLAGGTLSDTTDGVDINDDLEIAGNTTFGDAITDTLTFTARVAQDSDLIPITTTGTSDLGSSSLAWDNLYVDSVTLNGETLGNYWDRGSGALYPKIASVHDLLLGSTSTSSAEFSVTGINNGTPVASLSATTSITANGLSFNASTGTIQSLNKNTLTLGGSSTGNITIDAGSGSISLLDNTDLTGNLDVSGTLTSGTANAFTVDGSGNITTSGTTGLTLSGNEADINFSGTGTHDITADSGTLRIASNFTATGATITLSDTTFTSGNNNVLYTTNSSGNLAVASTSTANQCFTSNASTPSWVDCGTAGLDDWNVASGAISPKLASTLDFLLGSTATSSAEFAVTGINDGLPVATISATTGANAGNGLSLTGATSTLQSLRMNTLTLGGDTTGNILLDEQTDIGSAITGLRIAASGRISDIDGNISLGETTDFLGNLQIAGAGTILDTDSDLQIADNLDPSSDAAFDLGDTTTSWRSLYLTGSLCFDDTDCNTTWNNDPFWNQTSGLLSPNNSTVDFAIGGQSTAAAKFAFLNVNNGTPTASISGTTTGVNTYLTGNGNLATTAFQTLTLGGSTTGDISFTPKNIQSLYLSGTAGRVGIGTQTAPKGLLDISGNAGNNAALILNQTGTGVLDDIFTASRAGTTKFTIANTGSVYSTSSATTTDAFSIVGNSVTTGTGLNLDFNGLTTGTGLDITSTSTLLTSAKLLNVDHTATYTTILTDSGNLLNVNRSLTANASITADSANQVHTGATTNSDTGVSATQTHALGYASGNSRMVVTAVQLRLGTVDTTVSGVTYNGVAMTSASCVSANPAQFRTELWYIKEASLPVGTGSYPVVVTTVAGSAQIGFTTVALANVDQSTLGTCDSGNTGNTQAISTGTISSVASTDMVIDSAGFTANDTLNANGQTFSLSGNTPSFATGRGGQGGKLGATSMDWTITTAARQWAISAQAFKNAGTLSISGALANLTSNCTVTVGSCTDTSNILSLTQSYGAATGTVLNISNSGLGRGINLSTDSGGEAALVINKTVSAGDIFTASRSGVTKFRMTNDGSILLQGPVLAASDSATLTNNGSPAFTNTLGDQGSLIPNSSFESNILPGFADGWIQTSTRSATITNDTSDQVHGSSSMKVVFTNSDTAVYSSCIPIGLGSGGSSNYTFNYFLKAVAPLPTVRVYLDQYTSKSNCQNNTSVTVTAPIGPSAVTTAWASYGSGGTAAVPMATTTTWARVHFFIACTTSCTNSTVYIDGVRLAHIYNATGLDYAENYPADPSNIPVAGDIVSLNPASGSAQVLPTNKNMDQAAIGVVSTNPGQVLDDGSIPDPKVPVALAGRVPVKVSSLNGPIHKGDYIATSEIPGVGVKAIAMGPVIGTAMDDYDITDPQAIGTITVFINNTFYFPVNIAEDGSVVNPFAQFTAEQATQLTGLIGQNASESASLDLSNDPLFQDVQNRVSTAETTLSVLGDRTSTAESQIESLQNSVANLASQSAFLTEMLASMSGEQASGSGSFASLTDLDIENATISGDLNVLGRTTVTDLGVTGNISSGLLSIHGLDTDVNPSAGSGQVAAATINSIGDLYLQNNGLGGINILSGKVKIDTQGNIRTEGEITARKIKIDTTTDTASKSLGTGTIAAGDTEIEILTTAVTNKSKIFLTPTSSTGGEQLIVSSKQTGVGFTVSIVSPVSSNIKFDWFIIDEK